MTDPQITRIIAKAQALASDLRLTAPLPLPPFGTLPGPEYQAASVHMTLPLHDLPKQIRVGAVTLTPRAIYFQAYHNTTLQPGQRVRLTCTNPDCVNPHHLSAQAHRERSPSARQRDAERRKKKPLPPLALPPPEVLARWQTDTVWEDRCWTIPVHNIARIRYRYFDAHSYPKPAYTKICAKKWCINPNHFHLLKTESMFVPQRTKLPSADTINLHDLDAPDEPSRKIQVKLMKPDLVLGALYNIVDALPPPPTPQDFMARLLDFEDLPLSYVLPQMRASKDQTLTRLAETIEERRQTLALHAFQRSQQISNFGSFELEDDDEIPVFYDAEEEEI